MSSSRFTLDSPQNNFQSGSGFAYVHSRGGALHQLVVACGSVKGTVAFYESTSATAGIQKARDLPGHFQRVLAHDLGGGGDLLDRLAFVSKGQEEFLDLAVGCLAADDVFHHLRHFFGGERFFGAQFEDAIDELERRLGHARVRLKKFLRRSLPPCVRMDSG